MRSFLKKNGIYGVERQHLLTIVVFTVRRDLQWLNCFGREYLVPLDVMYGANKEVPRYFQVGYYIEMLQKLYEVARNNMSVRQLRSATYYDQKVADEELLMGELVYVFYHATSQRN